MYGTAAQVPSWQPAVFQGRSLVAAPVRGTKTDLTRIVAVALFLFAVELTLTSIWESKPVVYVLDVF
jgi:hypothetical protein